MKIFKSTIFFLFVTLTFVLSCRNISTKAMVEGKPELDTILFETLSKRSYEYLFKQQDTCNSIYRIEDYQHWYYDQYTGELTFSDNDTTKLIIDYEEVGSLSFKSNTWLWAWENPHLEEKIKSKIGLVRDYGIKRGFEKLKNPKWTADEYDSWEMTAIAAYLMNAKGAYRVPSKDSTLYSFMIFKSIRLPDSSKSN
ncbi:MAG TPA: hypothetical protein VIZ28_18595 [Chitinophagaceae bacterium]